MTAMTYHARKVPTHLRGFGWIIAKSCSWMKSALHKWLETCESVLWVSSAYWILKLRRSGRVGIDCIYVIVSFDVLVRPSALFQKSTIFIHLVSTTQWVRVTIVTMLWVFQLCQSYSQDLKYIRTKELLRGKHRSYWSQGNRMSSSHVHRPLPRISTSGGARPPNIQVGTIHSTWRSELKAYSVHSQTSLWCLLEVCCFQGYLNF